MNYYVIVNDKLQVADITGTRIKAFELRDTLSFETGQRLEVMRLERRTGDCTYIGQERRSLTDTTGKHRTLRGLLIGESE